MTSNSISVHVKTIWADQIGALDKRSLGVSNLQLGGALNVVIGPNEAGKSTLRRVVSFVLFGSEFLSYPIKAGLTIGVGDMVYELQREAQSHKASHRIFVRLRSDLNPGASPDDFPGTFTLVDQDYIRRTLIGVDSLTFDSVYSIAPEAQILNEKIAMATTAEMMAGAWLVGGGENPTQLAKKYASNSDGIWPPRATGIDTLSSMAKEFRELEDKKRELFGRSLSYDDKLATIDRLTQERRHAVQGLNEIEVELRNYEVALKLVEIKAEVGNLRALLLPFVDTRILTDAEVFKLRELLSENDFRVRHYEAIKAELEALSSLDELGNLDIDRSSLRLLLEEMRTHRELYFRAKARNNAIEESLKRLEGEIQETLGVEGLPFISPLKLEMLGKIEGELIRIRGKLAQITSIEGARDRTLDVLIDLDVQLNREMAALGGFDLPSIKSCDTLNSREFSTQLNQEISTIISLCDEAIALQARKVEYGSTLGLAEDVASRTRGVLRFAPYFLVLSLLGAISIFLFSGAAMVLRALLSFALIAFGVFVLFFASNRFNGLKLGNALGTVDALNRQIDKLAGDLRSVYVGSIEFGAIRDKAIAMVSLADRLGHIFSLQRQKAEERDSLEDQITLMTGSWVRSRDDVAASLSEMGVDKIDYFLSEKGSLALKGAIEDLSNFSRMSSECKSGREITDSFEASYSKLCEILAIDNLSFERDVILAVLDQATSIVEAKDDFDRQFEAKSAQFQALRLQIFSQEVKNAIETFGPSNMEQLERHLEQQRWLLDRRAHMKVLESELRSLSHRLDGSLFLSEHVASKDAIDRIVSDLEASQLVAKDTVAKIDLDLGELRSQSSLLATDDEMTTLSTEIEFLKARFVGRLREWYINARSREILESAMGRYASERIGEISELSSKFITDATGGRYVRVHYDLDRSGLEMMDGTLLAFKDLSRGTADLAYLITRFSAGQTRKVRIGSDLVNLPFILDETFAHQDGLRLDEIVKILIAIANDRQVIVFSCHDHIARRFVELSKDRPDARATIVVDVR
ncbi:AAA family ATPase [Acidithrix sp. C25]|uniref:AAA family ATPase n=1 Tax=Acidithrix sp. C25 TaxID=1671482 RepID=UPI00191BA873|nr:AAA family ATPase [Acidithrix sp. C25]CAG4924094.1 unnamed protein product [Acidithrix sp. C25]